MAPLSNLFELVRIKINNKKMALSDKNQCRFFYVTLTVKRGESVC